MRDLDELGDVWRQNRADRREVEQAQQGNQPHQVLARNKKIPSLQQAAKAKDKQLKRQRAAHTGALKESRQKAKTYVRNQQDAEQEIEQLRELAPAKSEELRLLQEKQTLATPEAEQKMAQLEKQALADAEENRRVKAEGERSAEYARVAEQKIAQLEEQAQPKAEGCVWRSMPRTRSRRSSVERSRRRPGPRWLRAWSRS